jgi:type I restriction enzyme S subunit
MAIENLITQHLGIWTSAIKTKSAAGRGSSKKLELVGVKKLREMILELAVRGKLVPQDPDDEPTSELLNRIEDEKAQLVKEGKIKKQKIEYELAKSDISFDIPNSWKWVKLGNVINFINGYAFKSSDFSEQGIGIVKIGDIQNGVLTPKTMSRVAPSVVANVDIGLRVIKGDLLIAMSGATTGKLGFNTSDEYFYLNQRVGKICPYLIDPYYLYFPLTTKITENLGKSLGSAIPNLSTAQINEITFALPPLDEQHRIVAKVDELMALCDQLEAQTEASIDAHKTLVEVLLATLTAAKDADELNDNWQTISQHFDVLFTTQASIDQLKQTILQLAVMGKLVKQDPNDEPASKLLERIATEKQQLIKDGKIKKQKPLPPITDDDKPFELPYGWEYTHMQDLCSLITDGTHQTPKYSLSGRPFISAQCVKPFRFLPEKCRFVSEEDYQGYIKNRKPEYRDILLARVGAGIGEAAIIDSKLEFAIYVSTGLLKPHREYLLPEYLVIWLNSPMGRDSSESNTLGKGVSQGNLNLSLIRSFLVSIPPFNEQHRIVAKVEELMALCDSLKIQLSLAQTTQLNFTDAIVEQAL